MLRSEFLTCLFHPKSHDVTVIQNGKVGPQSRVCLHKCGKSVPSARKPCLRTKLESLVSARTEMLERPTTSRLQH